MKTKISLLFSILAIASMVLTSCGGGAPAATQAPGATEAPAATQAPGATEAPAATEAPGATEAPAMPTTFNEAPSLADKGLPPVKERLPDTPVVTTPLEGVGKYGGTLHTASWWPEVGNVQLYFAV